MLPMDQPLKLSGDLEHDGTPDLDVDHALQLARSQRPELAAIDASIRQADAELSAARRRRLPTLSLVADYGLSSNTPGTNDEETYRYGAPLELPISAGGAIKAKERSEEHTYELP